MSWNRVAVRQKVWKRDKVIVTPEKRGRIWIFGKFDYAIWKFSYKDNGILWKCKKNSFFNSISFKLFPPSFNSVARIFHTLDTFDIFVVDKVLAQVSLVSARRVETSRLLAIIVKFEWNYESIIRINCQVIRFVLDTFQFIYAYRNRRIANCVYRIIKLQWFIKAIEFFIRLFEKTRFPRAINS